MTPKKVSLKKVFAPEKGTPEMACKLQSGYAR